MFSLLMQRSGLSVSSSPESSKLRGYSFPSPPNMGFITASSNFDHFFTTRLSS